ncbi:hypothetical protein GM418_26120 [Maribellus comscasis]|uniref:Uncharacterized protein n=1 Tax=Maribellus comscasis TaxID=2681766 RepID=A0A6I6K3L8_9BACT|nr:hypothetical protein [Maribellus comscasis]QGY47012.1 hypothetical protein GM418_26120 [Maribellus comscasis]
MKNKNGKDAYGKKLKLQKKGDALTSPLVFFLKPPLFSSKRGLNNLIVKNKSEQIYEKKTLCVDYRGFYALEITTI